MISSPTGAPTATQQIAARVAGSAYLVTNATAFFQNLYVLPRVIVANDPAKTAAHIASDERLFRLGIASDFTTFSLLVVLIAALYTALKPVHRELALMAALWRLIETAIMVTVAMHSLVVLQLLNGAAYQQALGVEPLQAMALSTLSIQSDQAVVGYVFLGLGSSLFCYLWLRSRYVPMLLALWGIIASMVCAAASFAFIVFPKLYNLAWYLPIGTFELFMGGWLLFRGLRFRANTTL